MRIRLLFMLAIAVVAIAICGPPSANADENIYQMQIITSADPGVVESPATAPAPLLVVADPGSTGGEFVVVASTRFNFVPITRRAAEFQRWRCRLLLRSAVCGCA